MMADPYEEALRKLREQVAGAQMSTTGANTGFQTALSALQADRQRQGAAVNQSIQQGLQGVQGLAQGQLQGLLADLQRYGANTSMLQADARAQNTALAEQANRQGALGQRLDQISGEDLIGRSATGHQTLQAALAQLAQMQLEGEREIEGQRTAALEALRNASRGGGGGGRGGRGGRRGGSGYEANLYVPEAFSDPTGRTYMDVYGTRTAPQSIERAASLLAPGRRYTPAAPRAPRPVRSEFNIGGNRRVR